MKTWTMGRIVMYVWHGLMIYSIVGGLINAAPFMSDSNAGAVGGFIGIFILMVLWAVGIVIINGFRK